MPWTLRIPAARYQAKRNSDHASAAHGIRRRPPLALFDNVMPATPSGKIELVSDVLAQRWGPSARSPAFRPRDDRFPLSLVSPASDKRISSTLLGAGGPLEMSLRC